jgi:hypothetical protein
VQAAFVKKDAVVTLAVLTQHLAVITHGGHQQRAAGAGRAASKRPTWASTYDLRAVALQLADAPASDPGAT